MLIKGRNTVLELPMQLGCTIPMFIIIKGNTCLQKCEKRLEVSKVKCAIGSFQLHQSTGLHEMFLELLQKGLEISEVVFIPNPGCCDYEQARAFWLICFF